MVRQFGQVVLVGVAWEETPILPANWMAREVKLQTTFGARSSDYAIALKLINDGRIEIDHMVSNADVIPIDGIQKAFEDLINPSTQVQVLIKPDA
jgi:threonine dehydrogenase-like Zn-dependent dehydrogenase